MAYLELNNIHKRSGLKDYPLDEKFKTYFEEDVRIIMSWDADATDIDLWITEPSGEKVDYSHNRSLIGGRMSRDFTSGYGPEEYSVRKAMKGKYKIQANYYGNHASTLMGPVTITIDIYTNYGRKNQAMKRITKRLESKKEIVNLGEINW